MPSNRTPELLAPAGGPQALRAAIANGADAVYLGVDVLNARRGAENFTLATLAETCRFAHLRGVRVYLTVNVVVLPEEFADALKLVDEAWAAGIDAVIVQDIGLLGEIARQLPHVRIHTSTQVNAHNSATIDVLASLGVSRVTLAREVSLAEIARFSARDDVEIESFVHGALCMCYSGQCLMSSLIGRRSANRGLCAQPCRLPYELLDGSGGVLQTPGAHLLSPKDLAGVAELPGLVETGVAALKIEGRMKSAEYVALVTGVYRAALDRALADADGFEVRSGEQAVLAESFSRGFSAAYLTGERGNEMMSYQRPNNRGVLVGRVQQVADGVATIALESAVESGDTLEFWTSAGRFAQAAGRLTYQGGTHDAAPAGVRAEIAVEQSLSAGDRVFRVRNAALAAAASRTFAADDAVRPLRIDVEARVVLGEPLAVTVCDAEGRLGSATGPIVEAARTKAVTAEEVAEHVGRLGGTPYEIATWSLDLSPNVGVGFSALHRVRREALEALEAEVLLSWAGRSPVRVAPSPLERRSTRRRAPLRLVVRVADEKAARACLAAGADEAHVPTLALGAPRDLPRGIVPAIGRVVHDRESAVAAAWARAGDPIAVGNLGMLSVAARANAAAQADSGLNAFNAYAVTELASIGAALVWLSPELSGRQIAAVASAATVDLGVGVFGRQEMMVTEHCILMAEGECDRACGRCPRRAGARVLRDRKGYEFPVVTDISGRSHLFNSVPLDLSSVLPEIAAAGISAIKVDLELETAEQAASETKRFREILERMALGVGPPPRAKDEATTSGHYFRGVL